MTQYFEITNRDAAARIGKLALGSTTIQTPGLFNTSNCFTTNNYPCKQHTQGNIADCGRIWNQNTQPGTLTILPHIPLPISVSEEFIRAAETLSRENEHFKELDQPNDGAKGTVIHPRGTVPAGFDLYILGAAASLADNPRLFTSTLIRIKERIPPDSALYAPALATSCNLALLIYLGIDILDYTQATLHAHKDSYFTKTGNMPLQQLKGLPCTCHTCNNHTPRTLLALPTKERARLLEEHNKAKMDEELQLVKQLIIDGRLRDYIEGACRTEPWQTASIRHLDSQHAYLEKRTPVIRNTTLYSCTSESQNRVEIQRFAQRIRERYTPPELDILLLLPCSAKKPYSTSNSHQQINYSLGKLKRYVHEVIITSPLGIVPRELELTYPASHYDTPVTGHWDLEERDFVETQLTNYLTQHSYKTLIAHVEGAYREICENVAKKLSCNILFTAHNNILSRDSLNRLKKQIEDSITQTTKKRKSENEKRDIMRCMADYQFGKHTGLHIIPEDSRIKAPYPKHQAYHDNKQIASIIPQYGTLALTLHGARKLLELDKHTVRIDEFKPKGSILAPGIVDADQRIREGDEVVIHNEQIIAIGRARMSGEEMLRSTRGIAIDLRHSTPR